MDVYQKSWLFSFSALATAAQALNTNIITLPSFALQINSCSVLTVVPLNVSTTLHEL